MKLRGATNDRRTKGRIGGGGTSGILYIYIKNLLISRDLVLSDLFWLLIFNMPQRTTIYQNIYRGTLSVLGIIDLSRSISNT